MIMIGCPIQNREWILQEYLYHLYHLDYDKKQIHLYFVVNNSKDNSLQMLLDFEKVHHDKYAKITIEVKNNPYFVKDERSKTVRRGSTYYWLAELRNMLLDKCVASNCDYLLSCDSDIMLKPDVLKRLLAHNLPIVSGLVLNGHLKEPDRPWYYTNMLKYVNGKPMHIRNYHIHNLHLVPYGKLLKIDFTGACILIKKEVCQKTRYGYFYLGEDGAFCQSAIKAGYDIFGDISITTKHIMSEQLLNKYSREW